MPASTVYGMNESASQPSQAAGEETIGAAPPDSGGDDAIKDPSQWVSGDDPMTESQKSYLDTLARRAGETLPAQMTKAEASEHIDRLRGKLDMGG